MIVHPEDASAKRLEHIAFIMDGNGRWAKKRGMPREYGHKIGAEVFEKTVKYCFNGGIRHMTVYAFSTENWKRPKTEVNALMRLMKGYLESKLDEMVANRIEVRFLGDLTVFDPSFRALMKKFREKTAGFEHTLNIAINYGGRNEIVRAVNTLIADGKKEITEKDLSDALDTAGIPDPDLIVRTAGEERLSNFLPWQSVYSEFYFTEVLWPDLSEDDIDKAVAAYYARTRRFGGV